LSLIREENKIKFNLKYSTILVIILTVISLMIISSIFKTVLAGLILSYIFYPVYKFLYSKLKFKTISAIIVTVLVLLLITVPTFFVMNKLSTEASVLFITARQYLEGGKADCPETGLCKLIPPNLIDLQPSVKAALTNSLGKASEYLMSLTTQIVFSLPSLAVNLFIVFFIMYYTLKDGVAGIRKLALGIPLKKHRQDALIGQFGEVASSVVYGTVIVALLQAVLAGVGFYLFGVPSPIIWALVTFVFALIPFLGPWVVWLPAALLLIFSGYYSGENFVLLRGVGLFLYGMFGISGIDNVLKPRIIGKRAKIHPAFIFVGMIGGTALFGVVGFVVGPVIVAMLKTAFDDYIQEKALEARDAAANTENHSI
jgi:predicted PurR-regulated permease PerM